MEGKHIEDCYKYTLKRLEELSAQYDEQVNKIEDFAFANEKYEINKKLEKLVVDCAKRLNMNVQFEIATSRTYTDADSIYHRQGGIPTYLFNIPLRYMHSSVEVGSLKDVEYIVELLVQFIKSLDSNTSFDPFK